MCLSAPKLSAIQWTSFKILGDIKFLQVSYFILIGVPLFAAYTKTPLNVIFEDIPITLKLGYLASLLISIAHMIFQGYCPKIIKRFESPNDLYRDMLEIKSLQARYLSDDSGFEVSISHCRSGFTNANQRFWFARLLCACFYFVGVALAVWVIGERTLVVLSA